MRRRLTLYEEPEVTDELYDFDKNLLDEIGERLGKLDTKAASIAAYAIAIIMFLVSTINNWSSGSGAIRPLTACGAITA